MIRIVVTALKGGTGVTTLVAGLSQAAAQEDLDVICLDQDDQNILKFHLGMVGMANGGEMKNGHPRISLLQSPSRSHDLHGADIVLMDLPRSRPDLKEAAYQEADAIVLVVPASATGVTSAPAIKAFLAKGENRFVILNQEDNRIALKKTAATYLHSQFSERIIGRIRQDESIEEAIAGLEPISRASPYSAAWTDTRAAFVALLAHMNNLPVSADRPL